MKAYRVVLVVLGCVDQHRDAI